jgi:hypothetical protein
MFPPLQDSPCHRDMRGQHDFELLRVEIALPTDAGSSKIVIGYHF